MGGCSPFVIESDEVERLCKELGLSETQYMATLVKPTQDLARVPISKFHVGAVGLGVSGRIFMGVNLEFEGLPLNHSIHAEQCLVANAAQHGEHQLRFIAVSAAPCGHCRQFLQELCGAPEINILIADKHAETQCKVSFWSGTESFLSVPSTAFSNRMEMEEEDPLDFDREDLFIPQSVMRAKPKKKVIGLDELLQEYYQEKFKVVERESKKSRMHASDSSDEEDEKSVKMKEKQLRAFVNECERQVNKLCTTVNVASWGQQIFGSQKSPPRIPFPGSEACPLLQILSENSEVKLMADLSVENGEAFMAELLVSGWLLTLVLSRGHCDEFTMRWTFNLMAHSSNENIEMSACNFLCSIILSSSKGASHFCTLDWVPAVNQIKEIVQIYGYLENGVGDVLITTKREDNDNIEYDGPPKNIRSWLKFVSACSQARSRAILTTSEAEDLAVVVIRFFLERRLHGLSSLLKECLAMIVRFFTDEEWLFSMQKIAFSLCCSLPGKDFNCLRLVESLSGVDTRIKELQKKVAFRMLLNCIDKQEFTGAKEIIDLLTSTNLRDKETDFVQMYICLVLADVWLWCNPVINENSTVLETWLHFLRGCSCQISSTDWRAYASKVRNKASYLIQMYEGQR